MEEEIPLGNVYEMVLLLLYDRPSMKFKVTRKLLEEIDWDSYRLVRTYDRLTEVYMFKLEEIERDENSPPVATLDR